MQRSVMSRLVSLSQTLTWEHASGIAPQLLDISANRITEQFFISASDGTGRAMGFLNGCAIPLMPISKYLFSIDGISLRVTSFEI
ncbi:MAG: hypothetical protein BECKG1743D_GA0114223_106683 [Candidatus Kentron sp. G]|nr:MAG: hypothetical protein BECKG1743D_GA0114223_106683 [Candidatus Kentron sp. G]